MKREDLTYHQTPTPIPDAIYMKIIPNSGSSQTISLLKELTSDPIYDCTCKFRRVDVYKEGTGELMSSQTTGRCDDTDCPNHGKRE